MRNFASRHTKTSKHRRKHYLLCFAFWQPVLGFTHKIIFRLFLFYFIENKQRFENVIVIYKWCSGCAADKMCCVVCSGTCARCRVCAGAPLQRGSVGCIAAPPSPPASSSHRSCPWGLLLHTAPSPCSNCSLSPESDSFTHRARFTQLVTSRRRTAPQHVHWWRWQYILSRSVLFSVFTSRRTTMWGCRTIWWIWGSLFMFFSTYESWRAFFLSITLMATWRQQQKHKLYIQYTERLIRWKNVKNYKVYKV